MSTIYNVLGVVGSVITSAALIPQLYKMFSTKSAEDVSYKFLCMYITGIACVEIYGIGKGLWPIYVPNALELLGVVTLLLLKVRYDGQKARSGSQTNDCGNKLHGEVHALP